MSGKPGAVWQQEDIVTGFIDERRKLIPLFDVQEDLVRRLMTRGGRRVHRFCDLGAGDGGFAELVMDTFPGSTGVLVDFSEPMLTAAQRRLAGSEERWQLVRGDLSTPAWRDGLPAGDTYDAVVSRLAIHHLPTSASGPSTGRHSSCSRRAGSSSTGSTSRRAGSRRACSTSTSGSA